MSEIYLYLTSTGRRTGNPHTIEIWYAEHKGCYYLCSEHREQSDWVQNILQNEDVSFYVAERGQTVPVRSGKAQIVEDERLLDFLRRVFDEKYGWSDGLFVEICAGAM